MGAEEPKILDTVKRQVATAFETFTAGEYRVTPLPADHCYPCLLYTSTCV